MVPSASVTSKLLGDQACNFQASMRSLVYARPNSSYSSLFVSPLTVTSPRNYGTFQTAWENSHLMLNLGVLGCPGPGRTADGSRVSQADKGDLIPRTP